MKDGKKETKKQSLISWTMLFFLFLAAVLITVFQGQNSLYGGPEQGSIVWWKLTMAYFIILLSGYMIGAKIFNYFFPKIKESKRYKRYKKLLKYIKIAFWILIIVWIIFSFLFGLFFY